MTQEVLRNVISFTKAALNRPTAKPLKKLNNNSGTHLTKLITLISPYPFVN